MATMVIMQALVPEGDKVKLEAFLRDIRASLRA